MRILISSPLDIFHTPISLKDPDAKYSPFGENAGLKVAEERSIRLNRQHIDELSMLDIYNPSFFS